jgi:hypothetical protein
LSAVVPGLDTNLTITHSCGMHTYPPSLPEETGSKCGW